MTRYAKAPTSGRNPHLGRTALLALLLILGAMALMASSAFALQTRLPTGASIGPEGTSGSATFKNPQAVTVDPSTGDIYVLDAGESGEPNAGKLYKFDAAGQPSNFGALAGNVIEGVGGSTFGAENEIAIAPPGAPGGTVGDIYLANNAFGALQIYGADGAKLGELGTGGETCGVAVDPTGHLFVGLFGSVVEYTPSTNPPIPADQTGTGTAENGSCNIAADGLGNIYASNFFGNSTAKLAGLADPSPTLIEPGGATLAVDPVSNDLYLDQGSSVAYYTSVGAFVGRFGSSGLSESHGVAIGSTAGKAYVANRGTGRVELYGPTVTLPDATTEPADAITEDSATLHGTIDADEGPAASCEFQYTTEAAFQADKAKGKGHDGFAGATSVGCTPPGPFTGSGAQAVSAPLTNLTPGTSYCFRVFAENSNGANPGAALCFLTLGPTVVSTTVANITTTSATLTGFVNPHGKPFSYHVDYGPSASYGSSVPVPDAAGEGIPIATANVKFGSTKIEGVVMSQGAFAVGQDIVGEGIPAGTTVTAVEGSTLTLSNFPTGGGSGVSLTSSTVFVSQPLTGLVPGAEYHARLVATNADATYLGPDRGFATYPVDTGLPDGRAYEMVSPAQKIGEVFPPEPEGSLGGTCVNEFCLPGLNDIRMPMQATPDGESLAFEGQPFAPGLSPGGNQYVSRRSNSGWTTQGITPPQAESGRNDLQSGFKAFSPDLSRGVLFQSQPALSREAPVDESGKAFNNLYLWEAGAPGLRSLVTVEPPHRDAGPPNGSPSNFQLSFSAGNSGSAGVPAFDHLVFEANDALTPPVPGIAPAAPEVGEGKCEGTPESDCNLYEWVGGQLRLINVLPDETAATPAVIGSGRRLALPVPAYQSSNVDHAISADGSRIFWSDASGQVYVRIDGEETAEIKDPDHGQFLTATPDGSKVLLSDGCLYSLEAEECEAELSGTPSAFLGIMGASEGLSRIYFVDTEALAAGAQAGPCKEQVADSLGCNLYVYDHGSVTFIGALSGDDNNIGVSGRYGSWKASRSTRTAKVSPDGHYLAFMSHGRHLGGDNCTVGGHDIPCFEVYEYDLEAESLVCVSCKPTGERPLGKSNLSMIRNDASFPQPESLPAEAEGRLFFESQDVLTTADTNGHIQDVYEWTPDGVGSCERAAGCVALISSGHSPVDSFFVNSTPSGNDAFFVTREQLLAPDKDDQLDVYDARVNGGIAEEITPPCAGEACRGAATSAPGEATPGSSTLQAPVKPKHCRKGFVMKHGRCVKKPTRHQHKHHKRSAQHKKTGGSK